MSSGITEKDSLFYVGEVPWHGQGKALPSLATAREALEASGLTWRVATRELRDEDHRRVPNRRVLVREDTGEVLAVVSNRYEPLQNEEAFRFFDEVTMDPNGPKYEVAGSLHGGRVVWILARLPYTFQIVRDDVYEPYLLLVNGHDGRRAITMFPTAVRVVCQNTLRLANETKRPELVWRRNHVGALNRRDVVNARKAVGIADRMFEELQNTLRALTQVPAQDRDVDDLIRYVYGPDASPKLRPLIGDLLCAGPGCESTAVRGTLYGLLNAITDVEDHYWLGGSPRMAGRLASALFGRGARRKARAFEWMTRRLEMLSGPVGSWVR